MIRRYSRKELDARRIERRVVRVFGIPRRLLYRTNPSPEAMRKHARRKGRKK